MKIYGPFIIFFALFTSFVIYGLDRLMETAETDSDLLAIQEQIRSGADPGSLLPATAAGPNVNKECDQLLYSYGLSHKGYPFVKSEYEGLYAADLGSRIVFFKQEEMGYSASELAPGAERKYAISAELKRTLAACKREGKEPIPTGLKFVLSDATNTKVSVLR